jgi:S1-C subfamily serine protease
MQAFSSAVHLSRARAGAGANIGLAARGAARAPCCARAAPASRQKRRQRARAAQRQRRQAVAAPAVAPSHAGRGRNDVGGDEGGAVGGVRQDHLGDSPLGAEDDENDDDDDGRLVPQHVLQCVVKVYCTHSAPNYAMPWSLERQTQSTSSGFIISERRIITCAHCVEHHTVVMVKRRGRDTRYPATVVAVGNECDIALLTVEDPEFWDDVPSSSSLSLADQDETDTNNSTKGNKHAVTPFRPTALSPGPLPELQDQCAVVGYPTGGENISITQGVCSRIEMQGYVYATADLLAVQLDAAINSGNSGGPVINDHYECVGVAFQSVDPGEADSIGYLIPFGVVLHFRTSLPLNWQLYIPRSCSLIHSTYKHT